RYADPASLLTDLDELEKALRNGGGARGIAGALLKRLIKNRDKRPEPSPDRPVAGAEELLSRIEDLQEENARIFCERDLMRHEMLQDEHNIEHLEAENARLACANDLLRTEVNALRGAMDGLRLRREAQRRARAES
ncbi:MAG: hypothetical protein ACYTDX_08105, partial [Planctomycetota bacterium]